MNAEPETETDTYHLSTVPVDSEDSEEEVSQEEPAVTSWSDLSIIERVGLNSVDLSEKDLETAFSQITLAFRCDQYTLKQRLQAEEHARNLAEENVQLELTRGRETLEILKGLCLDSKRSKILQKLELCLDILGGTVERISTTAEVLGAVHQEARVSRAVELMVAHVETLRRRHDRNSAELEEARKLMERQNSGRNVPSNPRGSPDQEEGDNKNTSSQPHFLRRRISVSIISCQGQEKRRQDAKKRVPSQSSDSSCLVDDRPPDPGEALPPREYPPEASAAQRPPDLPPSSNPACPSSRQVVARKMLSKSASVDTLQQRHKARAVSTKKKEKKTTNTYRCISLGGSGSVWTQNPLTRWLYRCRWALLFMYLFVLFSVVALIYVLWKLHDGELEL
ncbi:inositol 1,4,5-triphosphate receptor associated 2 [Mugil cephalus]|uniref:inositol 1,4,5-triphosphate receptor associated 2 n=1 Tax=Mugil cephalus TaxID=48193 RepID=UPI001FB620B4|nr:inositol 1,4,5-triphosphate receptor associated 2 [Mugil cephalus]